GDARVAPEAKGPIFRRLGRPGSRWTDTGPRYALTSTARTATVACGCRPDSVRVWHGSIGSQSKAGGEPAGTRQTPRGPRVPRRFCVVLRFPEGPRHGGEDHRGVKPQKKEVAVHGSRYGQVVQRREGVRLHFPGGWRGRLRP